MNIKEIRIMKQNMEEGIRQNITILANNFTQQTGLRIESITINMIDVTSLASTKSEYVLGSVDVELEKI